MSRVSSTPAGGATAQQVWEYVTRILTNLSDIRAAKIDNLDAAITSRAPAPTAYYYSGALAAGATYIPAAGKTVQLAWIDPTGTAAAQWQCVDPSTGSVWLDAHVQFISGVSVTILGPLYCDGAKIGFKNGTGGSLTIRLYGFV